jgi:hypothetical protein
MRSELAAAHGADISCPISTSIFARIAAEAAIEQTAVGVPLAEVTPFWRVIEDCGPVAQKLSCGPEFIRSQRAAEASG